MMGQGTNTISPLNQRIITGSVLILVVLLAIIYLNSLYFTWVSGAFFLLAAWEWSRLSGYTLPWQRVIATLAIPVISFILAACLNAFIGFYDFSNLRSGILTFVFAFWVFATYCVVTYPNSRHLFKTKWVKVLLGIPVLVPSWVALLALQKFGPLWLIYPIALIAAADSAAYFFGRVYGKRLLAPRVSPKKTWEGVLAGLVAAAVVSIISLDFFRPLSPLFPSLITLPWILLGLVTVLFSVVGDLFESLLKREENLKDSGSLLPGHGGILDRIDALTAALPIFAMSLMVLYNN